MKKILVVLVLISLTPLLPAKNDKFFASAGAAAFVPADKNFKKLYGDVRLSPEITLGYNLYRHFYFWLGGGFVSATGHLPVLGDEIKATQTLLSLGAGWETRRGRRWQGELFAALLMAGFREKAMGDTASKWAPGFDAGAGVRYYLRKKVFVGVTVGYAGAWTAVRTEAGETDIILGGLRLGGGLGFRF
jgi:opacity protein-like surface antigen